MYIAGPLCVCVCVVNGKAILFVGWTSIKVIFSFSKEKEEEEILKTLLLITRLPYSCVSIGGGGVQYYYGEFKRWKKWFRGQCHKRTLVRGGGGGKEK